MLWTIILILLILWALGGFLALGPLINVLVPALVDVQPPQQASHFAAGQGSRQGNALSAGY